MIQSESLINPLFMLYLPGTCTLYLTINIPQKQFRNNNIIPVHCSLCWIQGDTI